MPDTSHAAEGAYRRARLTAELLREQLTALGLTGDEARRIAVREDPAHGHSYVHIGTISVESAELLLAALPATTREAAS